MSLSNPARWAACATAGVALVAFAVPASARPTSGAETPTTYIVTLIPGATPHVAAEAVRQLSASGAAAAPTRVYTNAIEGYAAPMTAGQAAAVAADPQVASVEPDGVVFASVTQQNPPWGVDRIDQAALPLSATYTYNATGASVRAYVIDTGIRFGHVDFGGRAVSGFDAIDGGTADDCHGHGTHVSSTLGGSTFGVAKGVQLIAVRVLGCNGSGSTSGVIAGIDWAVGHHQAGQPAVANMSLGGGASTALDQAVNRLISDGVSMSVAAGNSNANACNSSPARVPAAITVAASTINDALASFSNRGNCVDIIAPGNQIPGAWSTSNTATMTISGTSMASPHSAGAAAKLLQTQPGLTPAQVATTLRTIATPNRISGTGQRCGFFSCIPATPNLLLFTNL
jgi:subtilisin family serine protease